MHTHIYICTTLQLKSKCSWAMYFTWNAGGMVKPYTFLNYWRMVINPLMFFTLWPQMLSYFVNVVDSAFFIFNFWSLSCSLCCKSREFKTEFSLSHNQGMAPTVIGTRSVWQRISYYRTADWNQIKMCKSILLINPNNSECTSEFMLYFRVCWVSLVCFLVPHLLQETRYMLTRHMLVEFFFLF